MVPDPTRPQHPGTASSAAKPREHPATTAGKKTIQSSSTETRVRSTASQAAPLLRPTTTHEALPTRDTTGFAQPALDREVSDV